MSDPQREYIERVERAARALIDSERVEHIPVSETSPTLFDALAEALDSRPAPLVILTKHYCLGCGAHLATEDKYGTITLNLAAVSQVKLLTRRPELLTVWCVRCNPNPATGPCGVYRQFPTHHEESQP